MADPIDLSALYDDACAFLTDLSRNNDRGWFADHKARYDSRLKRPSERLLADLAGWFAEAQGLHPQTKLFRPHRDVRFSEDKTPFFTHLHMMWYLADGRTWMLGISPDYATAGAGIMRFETDQQDAWRQAVASDEGAALAAMVAENGWRVDPPELKRVPPPWPADHPRADLLRQRGFVAWADGLGEALARDPLGTLQERFTATAPLMTWLSRVA